MVLSCDPSSNVTLARDEQPLKAAAFIVSTLAGISIDVNAAQSVNAPESLPRPPMVLSRDLSSNVTLARDEHLLKAPAPIFSTLAGISIDVNAAQSVNAPKE